MADDWRKLAAAASREEDPEKLRFLIHSLIRVFGEQQKKVKEEIDSRIKYRVHFMEKQGLDPFIP
jgi:hypothetical protein